ncbi:DUF192 domain-containing protein [Christiangramia forsetii]|uniref:Secreted protein containing DUF192 n=2 Tax=Christiangramia forsetii TaxID=411153 RepID=A0M503_CHRFK|nr:DUF192 domain-containing protein [Christiangramia forsetii]GGG22180.1 hypothetical protein GCM10011532_01560 [Christiangramia forsetii]CAL67698.1 secreted protein containing DUF192 [Christiangramia forsetii KT0803]
MKKRILSLATLSLFFSLSFTSCDNDEKKEESIETDPITFTKEGELYLIKASGDTLKKLDIELAESDYEHQTGLMYRESMEENQGMLFIYNSERVRNFYMKNTYISLDIIYYEADSTLVSIQKNTTPRDETSLPSEGPAQYILEVNGGLSDQWGLEQDDKFSLKKIE